MPSTEDPIRLDYASANKRPASRASAVVAGVAVVTAIGGLWLIFVGFDKPHLRAMAIGGCVLVGSALIAVAIMNPRPR